MLRVKLPQLDISLLRRNLLLVATTVLLVILYFWQIASIVPGLSADEAANIASSHSLHSLYANPVNAPHNIIIWALGKFGLHSVFYFRAVSVVFGLIFIGCFYKIARSWFGPLVGWLSALILASTPLVWLGARNATTSIMFLAPVAIAAVYFWLSRSEKPSNFKLLLLFIVSGLYLYTPGAIYFLLLGVISCWPALKQIIRAYPKKIVWLAVLLLIAALVPLVASLVHTAAPIKQLLLVPSDHRTVEVLKNVGWMGAGLVWQTRHHYLLQVGTLAVLSVAQIILAIFGLYAFWAKARSKVYGLLASILIAIVGAGLIDQIEFLLPAVAATSILAGAGLRYLLIEWQGVFPRNPLARAFAVGVMSFAVLISSYYGMRYSLAAWPHNEQTRQAYMVKYQ